MARYTIEDIISAVQAGEVTERGRRSEQVRQVSGKLAEQ